MSKCSGQRVGSVAASSSLAPTASSRSSSSPNPYQRPSASEASGSTSSGSSSSSRSSGSRSATSAAAARTAVIASRPSCPPSATTLSPPSTRTWALRGPKAGVPKPPSVAISENSPLTCSRASFTTWSASRCSDRRVCGNDAGSGFSGSAIGSWSAKRAARYRNVTSGAPARLDDMTSIALQRAWAGREYTPLMSWLRERLGRSDTESELVRRLRNGDEGAFAQLVDEYGPTMLRVARLYVRDRAVAEEVVQETWLAVLNGIDAFEGRSSLKTWIFRILSNRAKSRAEREGRSVPVSAVLASDAAGGEASVDPDRFFGIDHPQWPFHWAAPPRDWPEDKVLEREAIDVVRSAIEMLPDTQREVIRLRDVEGWSPEEVAELLQISDGNQRVLLHRARSTVRAALESYLNPELMST